MGEKRVIEQVASNEVHNDDWFLKDSPTQDTSKISATNLKAILGADGTLALEEIANAIAEEYDSTQTYAYNSWVFHEGVLYRCITQSVTGTWDATKWQAKTIKEFIADSENLITSRLRAMFGEYLPISTLDPPYVAPISKGDIFIYQQTNRYKFYRAKADHPQGVTEFDIDDWDEFDTVSDLIEDVTENAGKVDDVKVDGVSVVDENKVAQITTPDADGISYDNTTSGLEADDVQEAIDEVVGRVEDIENKESTWDMVGSASGEIATFTDGSDNPMKSCVADINPVQDLHGYDAPWPAGGGKNKLPLTYQTRTINEVTFTVHDDGTVTANGTATATIAYELSSYTVTADTSIIYNGISGGGQDTYSINCKKDSIWLGDVYSGDSPAKTVNVGNVLTYTIVVRSGATLNNVVFQPMIRFASVSDATYAPYSNICPISGWSEMDLNVSGVNVWDEEWEVGRIDGNTGQDLSSNDRLRSKGYILVKPNTTYNVVIPQYGIWVYPYKLDKTYKGTRYNRTNGQTFVVPNDCYYWRFEVYADYGTTYNNDISINYPSTDTEYHAYNGNTYTIDLDGTRYGGELDVVSGVLTVDMASVDLGTLSWSRNTSYAVPFFVGGTIATIANSPDILAPIYKTVTSLSGVISTNCSIQVSDNNVRIRDDRYETKEAFADAMDGIYFVYPLSTPTTIQLTPTEVDTLLGINNIWADTGDIDKAEYVRDATTIINELIARIEALEG